jgi:hypothetical protein
MIPGEPSMFIRTKLTGKIENGKVHLNETSVIVLSEGHGDYVPEERTGLLNAMGQIVGSGEDRQGVHGVFVLERIL